MRTTHLAAALALALVACGVESEPGNGRGPLGKADDPFERSRATEVLLTNPFCDVCEPADKDVLLERSAIMARVIELIDAADTRIDIAQFTFSRRTIEAALVAAHQRGVRVRIAMDDAQENGDTVATRLRSAGIDVRFIAGKVLSPDRAGLQHAKFMLVDDDTVLTGSNNWSSTGVSINDENTIVMRSSGADPYLDGFTCHFEAIWEQNIDSAGDCSNDFVAFTPSSRPIKMIKNHLRAAESSVDVLMHHLLFSDLIKELAKAAERGVRVRIVVNDGDQGEQKGGAWDRLRASGAEIRYKQRNAGAYQFMHNKLAIIDDRVLLNGSGNWSGSAFFNNFENFVRYDQPDILGPFRRSYQQLWDWSLTQASLDAGRTAAEQSMLENIAFFGNLHAHFPAGDNEDDGVASLEGADGQPQDIAVGASVRESGTYAYEYARDRGGMDFMMLSPHCSDERVDETADFINMSVESYAVLTEVAEAVTSGSGGQFVAMAGMEWSTNSSGNHVNILGASELAKVERGRFDLLYEDYLPERAWAGDIPLLQFNHPRTFTFHEGNVNGSWDQIFGRNLLDIPKSGERGKKFNDYGLDDYFPLKGERERWLSGADLPNESTVFETLVAVNEASAAYARLMEVTVGRGKEFASETPQNPSIGEDSTTGDAVRYTKVHSDWDYYLLRGFKLGPTANHDNHHPNWGTGHTSRTGVVARRLGSQALLRALDARSVFASEDEDLDVRLFAEERVPMGSEMQTRNDQVRLSWRIADPTYNGAYTVRVYVGTVGDTAVSIVHEIQGADAGVIEEVVIDVARVGAHFAYIEVHEIDADRMAWSAPVFIERL